MKNQKKAGIIISYMNIVLNMCVSIFFTPFLIKSLGQAEYGLYRTVQSFIGQMSVMTFGMSSLVTRNIIYYNTKNKQEEKENFLAMALGISIILSLGVLVLGYILYLNTDLIFKQSLTASELVHAKKLITLFIFNVAVTVLNDGFAGYLTAHERFIASKGIVTARFLLRIASLIMLLNAGFGSIAIIATDLILTILVTCVNIFYAFVVLKEKAIYHYFDKILFKTSIIYSTAILFQAIINQVNQNLDSFILGVMTDTTTVAVYSIALTIYTTYSSLAVVISSIYAPKIIRLISGGISDKDLTTAMTVPARYQMIISGFILSIFILFGKEFINLWVGSGYEAVYKITLILIIPMTLSLIENISEAVLNAKLKNMARSLILFFTAIANVIVSVILIKRIGYIGAAYGTSISVLLSVILLNIYYHKKIGIDIFIFFKKVFSRTLPAILLSILLGIAVRYINISPNIYIKFTFKILVFGIIYLVVMYFIGMNNSEKSLVKSLFKKIQKRG